MNMLITRARHDEMLDRAPALLRSLFGSYSRRWSLAGVTFFNVRADDRAAVAALWS